MELGFHRKYRPNNLYEYVGNTKNVNSILKVLSGGNRPQVYLLDGHAGCGKTTFARLIAKEYVCENRDDQHGACCNCFTCRAMDEFILTGNSEDLMNVREIDNSVSGNKSDIDEILNDAEIPSFDGGWKVFIFDECHLISKAAQGRMLKLLEEPPENVLLILCTTDPDMLLDTIRSRCQHHYTVSKPKLNELATLLKRVCEKEKVIVEDKALGVIATSADFVPRQALIQLETVINEKHDVTYKNTIEVLNVIADSYYFDFYKYLTQPQIDIFAYVKFLSELRENIDLKQFVAGLITFTNRGIYVYNGVNQQGLDVSEIKRYRQIFSKFSTGDIIHILKLLKTMQKGDIESELLLLGYEGIFDRGNIEKFEKVVTDNGNNDLSSEHNASINNYVESITLTEEEKDQKLSGDDNLSIDDLALMFSGEIIV